MKVGKYFSIISIIIATVFVILEIQVDILTYNAMIENMSVSDGDFIPTFVPFVIEVYFIFVLLSLVLSIIGFKKKNHFGRLALGLNILAVVYMFVPVGTLMAIF